MGYNFKHRELDYPHFAPLYVWEDQFSSSLLSLVESKGYLKLNKEISLLDNLKYWYHSPPGLLIDKEIKRIDGSFSPNKELLISTKEDFIHKASESIKYDAAEAENHYPGYTNLILCGGKDSLNLTLLPWENPVLIASAQPNYPLVKKFVKENGLNYEVIELKDTVNSIEREILINACRLNLEHCRWGGHLEEIVNSLGKKVIIWKGQTGDVLFAEKWKALKNSKFEVPPHILKRAANKILRQIKIFDHNSKALKSPQVESNHQKFFNILWERCSHWQGVHMAFLNELLRVPVLSSYHGFKTFELIKATDFEMVVRGDLRPDIGAKLFGREVTYPLENPGPPVSSIRAGLSGPKTFLELLKKKGIKIK